MQPEILVQWSRNFGSMIPQDYRSWPEQPSDLPEVDDTDVEVKRNKANVGAVIVSENAIPESLSRLIHPSCWYRLQKSVGWLLRFKQYLLS
jgi:hypothetical protein